MPDSSRFGRYEVEEEIARGGMGVIYRVRDPEMRRFLAMKVLLSDLGEERGKDVSSSKHSKLAARFTDEAQLTGQLDHPGIIPVYDMGRDDDGRLFFTMRLVKGRTLEEIFGLVRDGKAGWSVTRALGVLQKVCEAMGFAHEREVIHRDLKPTNVMVGRFGETYVMDWGLAKLVDEAEEVQAVAHEPVQTIVSSARKDESSRGSELETLEGDVMGTPAYMAPEQARGDVARVGARSDVYSLGAMLYHLLTGHPPFRPAGKSLSSRDVLDLLLAGAPPAVESQAPDVPAELCAICERAMAREPEARYGSMLEVAEDLQAYVENRVVQAYRRGAAVEFRKWVQRNRAIASSLAAVFVLVIAGLAAISYVQTRARDEVESKNLELAATNLELEGERSRTAEARDRAERSQAVAVENERVARASEEEALWQSYIGNIAAAHAGLEVGSASEARRRLAACPESLRGWEWSYLDQRADGSVAVLTGSETFLITLAINPVVAHVAAAGGMFGDSGAPDFAIRIWDFESGRLERVLDVHEGTVASLAYSPAGDVLASCDVSGNLRISEIESGEVIAEAAGMGRWIDFHPGGRWIVAAEFGRLARLEPGNVTLWDSWDRVTLASRELPVGANTVRFSPDGHRIALAGRDDHIRILDLDLQTLLDLDASGERLASDRERGGIKGPGVYSVDFSPDGRRLVSGSADGFVRSWDLETGERLRFFRGHRSIVHAVRWHPRFPWIVSSDESGSIRFWEAETGRALDVLRGHDEVVSALDFSALGDRLLSASRDNTVRVWDGQSGANDTFLNGFAFPNFRPYMLAFSPDSERVVWRSERNGLSVTDVRTGEDLCSIWTSGAFSLAELCLSGNEVWVVGTDGRVSRWSASTGERLSAMETGLAVVGLALQPGTRTMAVAGFVQGHSGDIAFARMKLVDLTSESDRWTTELDFFPSGISFLPDGTRCMVQTRHPVGGDSGVAVFEASSGTRLSETRGLPRLFGLAFFPDGERFAHTIYNAWDNSIFIRSVKTGELLTTLTGHAQPAMLDISSDGSRVVSGNWDGTLSLWSPERGEILVLPAHAGIVTQVGFSPDGRTIASLGRDGRRRLWSATPVESRRVQRMSAARRRRWSLDARRRVDELIATRVHPAAVVEALEADASLQQAQREAAILLARADPTSPSDLFERSRGISLEPGRSGAEYMVAMEAAQLAAELVPEEPSFHTALGAAQVRMGLMREALGSLGRAQELRSNEGRGTSLTIKFFTAIAHHHLGDAEAASREYELGVSRLRTGDPTWAPEQVAEWRDLEREVRKLLGRD